MKLRQLIEADDSDMEESIPSPLPITFFEQVNAPLPLENFYNLSDVNGQYEAVPRLNINSQSSLPNMMSIYNYAFLQQLNSDIINGSLRLAPCNSFNALNPSLSNLLLIPNQQQNFLNFPNQINFYGNLLPNLTPIPFNINPGQQHFQGNNQQVNEVKQTKDEPIKLINQNISPAEKTYCCSHCESKFYRRDELYRHEKIHSGVRNLPCPYCEKKFIRSDHRRTHIRTHTGEKPYPCEICMKSFARSDERARHWKKHHKVTNKVLKIQQKKPQVFPISKSGYNKSEYVDDQDDRSISDSVSICVD